jgi:signal transduction histidine kinase
MTDRLIGDQLQLVRAEKLASVGRLAAGVAHEIGNPLGAIAGYLHLLRRAGSDPQAADAIDAIEREASRVDRIVRGLLDYARPRKITPTPVDVNETIEGAVRLLADQGVLRRVNVKLELEPSSPVLFGERHDLEQALVNLLLNAVDAMKGEGSIGIIVHRYSRDEITEAPKRRANDPSFATRWRPPDPRVLAWLEATHRPDEIVKLIVADSGPGVPAEIAERVFDPFFTTKGAGKGTGLGLAIVQRIVESFSGAIWLEQAREGGAAFHIVFPIATLPVGRSAFAPAAEAERRA